MQTDKILQTAEEIAGPYLWGVYDVLILPPSFPYGGMENPCLTFISPTVLVSKHIFSITFLFLTLLNLNSSSSIKV